MEKSSRADGMTSRRELLCDGLAGAVAASVVGSLAAQGRALAQEQKASAKASSGLVCPISELGGTAGPPAAWYYYARDCSAPQLFGMSSPVRLTHLGCPGNGGDMSNCHQNFYQQPVDDKALIAAKKSPIDASMSDSRWFGFLEKDGVDLRRVGIQTFIPPDHRFEKVPPEVRFVENGANYQMMISNRRRAVRVFLASVEVDNVVGRIGFGQEIDVDPGGLPTFDDERRHDEHPKYYLGYRTRGDQFFHILTKN